MNAKIVRTDRELECPHVDAALRKKGIDLVLLPEGVNDDELARETSDADVILMCYTPITAPVINGARRLKGIVKYGVGIDAIAIDAAKVRNIPVVNVPDYAEETVAEAAFALMITLARKLMPLHMAMRNEGWAWPESRWLASDIFRKTVGLVGFGRIGRSMARMCGAGFGAQVLAFDPHVSADTMKASGAEKRDNLKDLMGECDFVSVHCALSPETRHLVGAAEIAAMTPSAFLINVSRGALVDEVSLLDALRNGRIAGAGLDTFSKEPLALEGHCLSDLFTMDNVILTPHLAFYTAESMRRLEEETLERCFEVLEGRPVLIKSRDPRLLSQTSSVRFA